MAKTPTARLVMLSIKPHFADAILRGEKRVEFRRRRLPPDIRHVVIYATSPVQRVVGIFEIDGIESTSPNRAWNQYREVGGIEQPAFDAYFEGSAVAHVIRIRTVKALRRPFALNEIDASLKAPQSFIYLRDDRLRKARTLLSDVQAQSQLA